MDESILCPKGGYTAFHKLFGDTGVVGPTAWFFALYVSQNLNSVYFYRVTLCSPGMCRRRRVMSVRCKCSVPAAEWMYSSAVGIAQLVHAVGESIFCHEAWRRSSSQMTLGRLVVFKTQFLLLQFWFTGVNSKCSSWIWQLQLLWVFSSSTTTNVYI